MPYIQIEAVHPTPEQKARLVAELTRCASEILGVDRQFFYVLIKENDAENWGICGETLPNYLRARQNRRNDGK